MDKFLDYVFTLLSQFSGGPGPEENNLVRFGLAAVLLAVLFFVAWSRQRQLDLPREKMLVWGFGLGFVREFYMFARTSIRIVLESTHDAMCTYSEPLEHALELLALVVIAGSFLRYILDDERLSRRYLLVGVGVTVAAYLSTFWWWAQYLSANPETRFHQTWSAYVLHGASLALIVSAIALLSRAKGWLRNVVMLALLLFLLGETGILFNYATDRAYRYVVCPLGNSLHLLAIPILGYVYIREQGVERQQAEDQLEAYRQHLEELVEDRTAALSDSNAQLQQEIVERIQAEVALEKLSRQNDLILSSAGEGILGIDTEGKHTFVNPAAARMLGFKAEELIGMPSHATWHHTRSDGSSFPEAECPLHAGYKTGTAVRGEDQVFWRSDGTAFSVEYTSTPVHESGRLTGAVVVFRDITERKQAQEELARRNAELAGQNAIAATISQSLDLDTILNTALDRVLDILGMDAGGIYLLDPSGETMTLQAHKGAESSAVAVSGVRQLPAAAGISGRAMSENRPVVLDAADYPAADSYQRIGEDFQTVVSTPLVSKGWVIGALTLGSLRRRAVPQQILNLLASIGQQIGMAVENAHLYQQTERWAGGLARLHEAGFLLNSSLDTATIYDQIAEQGAKLLNCEVANLYLWDEGRGEAIAYSSYGVEGAGISGLRLMPEESQVLAELIDHRRPVAIKNHETDPRVSGAYRERFKIKAELALPLLVHERLLGFLFLIDQKGPRLWLAEEIDWAESLVNHASIALENALLYERVERAAALEERQRIAAEIHDGLAQTLGYLGLKADQTAELIGAGQGESAVEELGRMRDAIGQASQEVRGSIASLQQSPYSHRPLQAWLSDLVAEYSQDGGTPITWVSHIDDPLLLPPSHVEQVLRVVQEALLNAGRHAEAREISVSLEQRNGQVAVTVEDDGKGFDPGAQPSDSRMRFGLSIMRARAARLRGGIQIHTAPGEGTGVILTWPLSTSTFTLSRIR
jgi:PAS domain S-box-containing protein